MMYSLMFLIGAISLPGYATSKEIIRALEGTPPENIAKGKPTLQSSNYSTWMGLSKNAVDGNTNASWGGNSVTHTRADTKAWWQVDLQDNFTIDVVKVYNRQDCCSYRLDNFDLIIMNNGKEVWKYEHAGTAQKITTITVPGTVMGDKIKVQLRSRNYLSLAEVEVFAKPNNVTDEPTEYISDEPTEYGTNEPTGSSVSTKAPSSSTKAPSSSTKAPFSSTKAPSSSTKAPSRRCVPLLADLEGWVDGKVKWHTPPSGWGSCGAVTTVYGVAICVSKAAWKKKTTQTKATHIAQVFYQLIDNDADGVPDDPVHLKYMVDNGYLLWVPLTQKDSNNAGNWPDEVGGEQMTGIFEAVPGTCDSPANRGADPKDRSTWAAVVENTQGCNPERDATTEEIHHLMTMAAGKLWPDLWGASFKSEAGKAVELTNGNCGWGFKKNWIDPSSNKCKGQYAYNDRTCNEACIVVEGIYWASVSYIGGLYTKQRIDDARSEWLMATPNDGMTIYPKSVTNAKPLETGSPALYKLVSTTETESGFKWLPAIMPDGKYMGKQTDKCTGISKKNKCKNVEGCEWKKKKCQLKPTTPTTCEAIMKKGQCKKAEGCGWKKKKCQPCKTFTTTKDCGRRGCTWSGDACM